MREHIGSQLESLLGSRLESLIVFTFASSRGDRLMLSFGDRQYQPKKTIISSLIGYSSASSGSPLNDLGLTNLPYFLLPTERPVLLFILSDIGSASYACEDVVTQTTTPYGQVAMGASHADVESPTPSQTTLGNSIPRLTVVRVGVVKHRRTRVKLYAAIDDINGHPANVHSSFAIQEQDRSLRAPLTAIHLLTGIASATVVCSVVGERFAARTVRITNGQHTAAAIGRSSVQATASQAAVHRVQQLILDLLAHGLDLTKRKLRQDSRFAHPCPLTSSYLEHCELIVGDPP